MLPSFALPPAAVMLDRLIAVNDTPHLQEKFYPLLTKRGGEEKVAMGVVMLLQIAITEYCKELSPLMVTVMNLQMDEFIDALCPCPYEEIGQQAKEFYNEVRAGFRA